MEISLDCAIASDSGCDFPLVMFHIMGLEMRMMFHSDSVQRARQYAPRS